ncbi:MAG: AAA family ATPase [Anaerolineales bacterium]|nr:AAA family ATPase [Anaerolineales bacterium]
MSVKSPARPPLRGWRLVIARLGWLVVTLVAVGTFLAGIPIRYEQLRLTTPPAARASEQLSPDQVRLLEGLGFSLDFYAGYVITLFVTFALIYIAIAVFIFWRKSDDGLAIFVSLALICFGVTEAAVGDPLAARYPWWDWPVEMVEAFGTAAILIIFYIFPDGCFVPGWTRPLTIVYSVAILIWLFFPSLPSNPLYWATWQQNPLPSFILFLMLFGVGAVAQIYRYHQVSSPTQRQQTKWVVYGFVAGFVAGNVRFLPLTLLPSLGQPPLLTLLIYLIGLPLAALLVVILPISMAFSILRYRLWDIDLIISLTLIYTTLTVSLGLVYLGSIGLCQWLILNTFSQQTELTNQQAGGVLLASTLIIAALFRPWQRRLQSFIDRRFFREKVDFQQAFTAFSSEVRLIIDLPELLHFLVNRVINVLHIAHGAVFLRDATGAFRLAEARDLPADAAAQLLMEPESLRRLQAGEPISPPEESGYALWLPLIAPQAGGSALIGVLTLGPRLSEQPYSGEDQTLLLNLAHQAGTAIAVAQLIEAERQLEAYQNSPIGRAKSVGHEVLVQPEMALIKIHRLAQQAGQAPEQAALLSNLPLALESLNAKAEATLAEGLHYIHTSQFAPEMLTVGLRTLVKQLEAGLTSPEPPGQPWREAEEALVIYRLCQAALEVETIAAITAWQFFDQANDLAATGLVAPPELGATQPHFLSDLVNSLAKLQPVVEALRAYEQVETSDDKLFYLARAIEQLGRCHWQVSPQLKLPERLIKQQIVDHWTTLATEAVQTIQGRAELVVNLMTRRVIAADPVTLALEVSNVGRSSASNLVIELLPGSAYDVLDGQAKIEQLAVGRTSQAQFIIRPNGEDVLQPQFQIAYDDRAGAGHIQTVTGSVQLQSAEIPFAPLVNPYAPGLPLRRDSPVFFGREDIFSFIQEALDSPAAGRVLVLTGQRRMGKTSLAQQLPARLAQSYLTVYLDGQSLAIDPGMTSFFYDLALEIAQTLMLPPPSVETFQTRPSAAFEREFLPQVLTALGRRRLLILFDEFEELEMRVTSGYLDPSVFSYLRHLMQHVDQLAFIFIGTHKLETLNPAYWSAFFNVALHRRVSFLEESAARALITEPLASQLIYDDLAVAKMLRTTGGYPYFLQLLGHIVVSDANQEQRNFVALNHVNQTLDRVLELGEANFIFLWSQLTAAEQDLLGVAALLRAEGTDVTVDGLVSRLGMDKKNLKTHFTMLEQRELLRPIGTPPTTYEFTFDLLRLWITRFSKK